MQREDEISESGSWTFVLFNSLLWGLCRALQVHLQHFGPRGFQVFHRLRWGGVSSLNIDARSP